ncbi:hypothetical protein K227x_59140 [Rubripirellula lacrimiformis]|uniref:Uncharacterized protein n=1 Tax=Rubripirellula lacrimiformis TaxID=1930273 RepID=A0A517NK18_9BACT|nr:hypothetical protein [Rubripirellula lacrimiformis]QDT07487.1 hypothetical protein K227x_59140 [Rubripirellula lacrimiformis]
MNDPFQLILDDRPHNDVLHAAAAASKFEIDTYAGNVSQTSIAAIGDYALKVCRTSGVQAALMNGGMLELFAAVSHEEESPEVYDELVDRIGIGPTQAYRCRAVWREFGKTLIDTPEIRGLFVAEALKILSGRSSSRAARQEAIELARQGTEINIKVANMLQSKHAAPSDDAAAEVQPQRVARSNGSKLKKLFDKTVGEFWTFTGRVVQIVLEPTAQNTRADRHAVIEDLQAAIERLQQEIIDESQTTAETTHV